MRVSKLISFLYFLLVVLLALASRYAKTGLVGMGCNPTAASGNYFIHNFTFRSRSALVITETELKLIATPAIMGLNSTPQNG